MRTYARIQNGLVVELLKTDSDIAKLFPPELVWVDVSGQPNVKDGWRYDGKSFTAPSTVPPAAPLPTIAELQAQLAALNAKMAMLAGQK